MPPASGAAILASSCSLTSCVKSAGWRFLPTPFNAHAGVFSGAADDQLCCWRVTAEAPHLRLQAKLPLKQKGVAEIAVRQDGRMFASAGWDGRVRIFRCAKPKPLAVLQVGGCWDARPLPGCACASPRNACCGYRVLIVSTLSAMQYHQKSASAVAWSPQDGTLASASRDGTIALWELYKTA